MKYVTPGADIDFSFTADTGLAGTAGAHLVDSAGGTSVARTTSGISEVGSTGVYVGTITAPNTEGTYHLLVDDGSQTTGHIVVEEVRVTASTVVSASGTNYLTNDAFKTTMSLTGQTFVDADATAVIAAACRGIDRACGRHFYSATETRYYRPRDEWLLEIEDVASITTLQTDPAGDGSWPYTWTLHTDYELEPYNAATDGWPFTQIRRRRTGSYTFPCVERSVKVVGTFGWPSVPSEIVTATSLLASRLLERTREAPLGVVTLGPDLVGRIARTDPDVAGLIAPYIKFDVLVGA